MEDLLNDLREKGLFEVDTDKPVRTEWYKSSEKPEIVIEALYDLSLLNESELKLLANLSVLPAEFLPFRLLKKVVTEFNGLQDILISLYQKGWIDLDGKREYN